MISALEQHHRGISTFRRHRRSGEQFFLKITKHLVAKASIDIVSGIICGGKTFAISNRCAPTS